MHPTILALGYSEAAMLLRDPAGSHVEAIIAIRGSHEHAIEAAVAHRLELEFDDVDEPNQDDPVARLRAHAREKWAREIGRPQTPPTREHAAAIIEFARQTKDLRGTVLCHCSAGVSRSTAAALLCLAVWKGEGRERECVGELLRAMPCAAPHRDLVRWGDELLGRRGRLVEAVTMR
jgi:predicted protein tyrosine phosphatase